MGASRCLDWRANQGRVPAVRLAEEPPTLTFTAADRAPVDVVPALTAAILAVRMVSRAAMDPWAIRWSGWLTRVLFVPAGGLVVGAGAETGGDPAATKKTVRTPPPAGTGAAPEAGWSSRMPRMTKPLALATATTRSPGSATETCQFASGLVPLSTIRILPSKRPPPWLVTVKVTTTAAPAAVRAARRVAGALAAGLAGRGAGRPGGGGRGGLARDGSVGSRPHPRTRMNGPAAVRWRAAPGTAWPMSRATARSRPGLPRPG